MYWALYCWREGPGPVGSVVKTLPVALLAIGAALAGAPSFLVLALGLGALGDFALTRRGDAAFLTGLVAFLLSHIVYIALFITTEGTGDATDPAGWHSVPLMIALPACLPVLFVVWRASGEMRWPVAIYGVVIVVMGGSALWVLPPELSLVMLGAACFVASDALLGARLFLWQDRPRLGFWADLAIWPLYWSAQYLILSGMWKTF